MIAVLFLFTGLFTSVPPAFSVPHEVKVQGGRAADLHRLASDYEIRIPPELGLVDEFSQGGSGKTIIYIQDAHDSLEAQENIAKIIKHLVAHYGVKTVFEEGYEDSVPTDKYFGGIDPRIKEKISYFLMDHLRVGGAEYAHINRTKDFNLIGADSLELHKENIDQYRLSAAKKNIIAKDLKALERELKTLADSRFPKELKEWLKIKEQFDAKKLDLFTYLGRTMPLLGKNETEKAFGVISFILEAIKTNDPAVIEKAKHIDAREVFDELVKLEGAVAETYLHSTVDKRLFEYDNTLNFLDRLNDLQVSQEEYEAVKASLKTFDTKSFAKFVFSQLPKTLILSRMWEQNIKDAIKFYEVAKSRDHAVEKQLNTFINAPGETTAVLVFGGFHKEGIKKILESKGFAYKVVSPRITKEDARHREYYKQLMTMGRLPFEQTIIAPLARSCRPLPLVAEPDAIVRAEIRAIARVLLSNPEANLRTLERYLERPSRSEMREATGARADELSETRTGGLDPDPHPKGIPEGAVPFREGTFASLIDFLPTLRCQLKCLQCWARNFYTQKEISRYGTKEPSFEEILRTIDLLADRGIEGISFSGGEPTIVPRFDEIIAYVKSKGMKVFVNTNGLQFKMVGGEIFIELYKQDRKSTYLVPLEKFISNVDQFCFSLDTVDPHSFRGEAPLLWPKVITRIKAISAQRNKDIEIVITTTVTRENMDKVETDLPPYVEGIILDVFNKTKQHYPSIRPPIWKFNIFQPLKSFPDELKKSLGITYDEFTRLHDEVVQRMRERVRAYLAREGSSFAVDQVLRMNRTLQEEKSYKYLMILPNGVLVTTVDDGATSYGLHERGFEVAGYLDKTDPWVYKKISEAIADGIDEKFSKLGAEFAPVVKVIKGSDKGDPAMGVLEKKISSFDQDSFDHLVVLHDKDEFPVLLGQEIAKRVGLRFERVRRKGDRWEIYFTDQTGQRSILSIWINQDRHEVVYQSDHGEFYSLSQMRDVLETLANRNVRLADQGYFERMSLFDLKRNLASAKRSENPAAEFEKELNAAQEFLGMKENSKVYLVETDEITFGIARVRENDVSKIYVETSFLKRLKRSGDKTSLTRAFIHALYHGSSEEKVYQEFEYARSVYRPEQLNELIGGDFVGLDQAISDMIRKPRNSFQRAQADLIARRLKLQVWNMAVLRLNGETRHVRVRVNDRSPALTGSDEDSGDVKMLYYSVAANPFHFGHIEALLRGMVQSKADIGVIRVQGADDGKSLNGRTIEERHDIVAEFVAHMKRYVKDIFEYSDIGRKTSSDGESDFIDLIKLNAGRRNGRLYAFNLGGSDHRHFFVPDYEGWEQTHEYRAKIKDGEKIPDTLLKYYDLVRRDEAFFKANKVSFGVLFSERDPRESEFLPEEVALAESLRRENLFQEALLRGMNYESASATAIREALAGIRDGDVLMILPAPVEDAIMGNVSESRKIIRDNPRFDSDRYRGFIIELPVLIKQLSMKSSTIDFFIFEHWLEVTKQNRGREITSREIVDMFNGKETPLSLEEVEKALKVIKTKTATDNASGVGTAILTESPDHEGSSLPDFSLNPRRQEPVSAESPAFHRAAMKGRESDRAAGENDSPRSESRVVLGPKRTLSAPGGLNEAVLTPRVTTELDSHEKKQVVSPDQPFPLATQLKEPMVFVVEKSRISEMAKDPEQVALLNWLLEFSTVNRSGLCIVIPDDREGPEDPWIERLKISGALVYSDIRRVRKAEGMAVFGFSNSADDSDGKFLERLRSRAISGKVICVDVADGNGFVLAALLGRKVEEFPTVHGFHRDTTDRYHSELRTAIQAFYDSYVVITAAA